MIRTQDLLVLRSVMFYCATTTSTRENFVLFLFFSVSAFDFLIKLIRVLWSLPTSSMSSTSSTSPSTSFRIIRLFGGITFEADSFRPLAPVGRVHVTIKPIKCHFFAMNFVKDTKPEDRGRHQVEQHRTTKVLWWETDWELPVVLELDMIDAERQLNWA